MFYPAARTYGAPTTGRRKLTVHNENDLTTFGPTGGGLPSKTPSRAGGSKSQQLLPGTVGRVGLGAKTEGRDRNVLKGQQGVEGNGKGTGKGKDEEIEPKRLFASTITLPPSKSLSNLPLIPSSVRKPQPSKTPARPPPSSRTAHALRTPAPTTFRIAQDISTPLPSATRRRRSRSSQGSQGTGSLSGSGSTPLRPTGGGDQFKTPLPSAKWDEGDSLGSIEEVGPGLGVDVGLEVLGEEEEEGDWEVEYMPPRAVELPYEPDWDVEVDIHQVTKRLQGFPSVIFHVEDIHALEPSMDIEDNGPSRINLESDEWLDDPLFPRKPVVAPVALLPKPTTSINRLGVRTAPPIVKPSISNVKPIGRPAPSVVGAKKLVPKSTAPTQSRGSAPSIGRTSVLAPRKVDTNLPARSKLLPKVGIKGSASQKDEEAFLGEDEDLRKAIEEMDYQDLVLDLNFD